MRSASSLRRSAPSRAAWRRCAWRLASSASFSLALAASRSACASARAATAFSCSSRAAAVASDPAAFSLPASVRSARAERRASSRSWVLVTARRAVSTLRAAESTSSANRSAAFWASIAASRRLLESQCGRRQLITAFRQRQHAVLRSSPWSVELRLSSRRCIFEKFSLASRHGHVHPPTAGHCLDLPGDRRKEIAAGIQSRLLFLVRAASELADPLPHPDQPGGAAVAIATNELFKPGLGGARLGNQTAALRHRGGRLRKPALAHY